MSHNPNSQDEMEELAYEKELLAAIEESYIYGHGFIMVSSDLTFKHVKLKDVMKTMKEIDERLHESCKVIANEN